MTDAQADGSIWLKVTSENGQTFTKRITSPTIGTSSVGGVHTNMVEACNQGDEIILEDDLSNVQSAQFEFNTAVAIFVLTFGFMAFTVFFSGGTLLVPDALLYASVSGAVLTADNNLNTVKGIYSRDKAFFHCV
ncbi:MAG: hypothetical protein ACYDA1_03710 [Vulcanimicrobiaceae bacterium]